MVPPAPHVANAACIAGTSSVAAFPAEIGVQTELLDLTSASVFTTAAAVTKANTATGHRNLTQIDKYDMAGTGRRKNLLIIESELFVDNGTLYAMSRMEKKHLLRGISKILPT